MQGLEIGGGSTYGAMDPMDVGHGDNISFDPMVEELPAPPQDNNQVAAWYDTDL